MVILESRSALLKVVFCYPTLRSPGATLSALATSDTRQTEKYTIIHSAAALVVCVLVARVEGVGAWPRLPRSLYLDRAYSSGSAAARRRCRPSLGLQGGTRARLFTEQRVLGCGLPSLLRVTPSASRLDNGSAA